MNENPPAHAPGPAADRPPAGVVFTVRLSPDGRFTFHSPTPGFEDLLELSADELGRLLTARTVPFLPDENPPAFWETVRRSAEDLSPWRREVRVVGQRTGRETWFRVDAVPARDPGGAVTWSGLAADVTDLKAAERRLREAYRKLDFHMDNTPLAVVEWEGGTRIARWNGQAEVVFGWTAGDVIGKSAFDFRLVHEDDVDAVRRAFEDMVSRRRTQSFSVNRNYTRTGAVIWCEWYNSALIDDAGRVVSVLSLALDVTARWAAADALARSEAGLRAALGSAKMIGWDWDLRTRQGFFSTDFAAFFGLPAGTDYGLTETARAAVHPDDRAAVEAAWDRAVEAGGEFRFEYRGAAPWPDGGPRWFSARGQVLRGPDGRAERIVAVTTDVTDQKRAEREREVLERQLLDTQKWESLGVLAGGVAHDFNNILTVVLGSAGLARRTLPDSSPAAGLLTQIETAARRAGDLCRQLLAYAGRGSVAVGRTDLARVIRESAALLRVPAAGKSVALLPDPTAPAVRGDPAQVRQVLVNLVMNAAEAVGEDGGEVAVRTRAEDITGPPDGGFVLPPAPGRYTVLEVADTGPGIAPDVRARMFDPFFTTRFAGRGLGLSAVLGIVRAHQGAIRVDTQPGRGTTVWVYWPVAAGPGEPAVSEEDLPSGPTPAAVPVPGVAPSRPRPADPERPVALVVDDEMYVREVAASTLEELGYEAVLAADGPDGLEQFRLHRDRVRVAVLDVMMPGMTGEQVLAALRVSDPTLPVVVISGFTDRRSVKAGAGVEFLQKPFHPEDLAAAVQRVTQG